MSISSKKYDSAKGPTSSPRSPKYGPPTSAPTWHTGEGDEEANTEPQHQGGGALPFGV